MAEDSAGRLRSWFPGNSLDSEAARLLNGSEQLVVELVVVFIGRNVNPIETGKDGKGGGIFFKALISKNFKLLMSGVEELRGSLPGVGLGQVVGTGVDLVDGEEPRSSSTCGNRAIFESFICHGHGGCAGCVKAATLFFFYVYILSVLFCSVLMCVPVLKQKKKEKYKKRRVIIIIIANLLPSKTLYVVFWIGKCWGKKTLQTSISASDN